MVATATRRAARAALRRRDRVLDRYHLSIPARRVKLLRYAGATELLDIGANEGQWAENVRENGWAGPIWSFEPLSSAYAALERAATADPLWHVQQIALGDESGEVTLNVSEQSVYSSVSPMLDAGPRANPGARYVSTERVRVERLDDLALHGRGTPGVKIDVQGFESKVMDGAPEVLGRATYLEVELSLVPCYEGEPLYREMLDRITGYGFRLALVEPVWPDPETGEALQFNGMFLREPPSP